MYNPQEQVQRTAIDDYFRLHLGGCLPPMIRAYLPAILMLMAGTAALPVAVSSMGDPTKPVAVVFAPGTTLVEAMELVLAAGGTPLRSGPFPNIVVARSAHPDFATSLHQHGALLLLDPLFAGCAELRRPPS